MRKKRMFEALVYSLKMQAEMYLGLFGAQEGEDAGPNLPAARQTIDMLAMLSEKTRGNLTLEEQRAIENSLTELRFRFVQVSQETAAKPKEADTPEPPAEAAGKEESAQA